MTELTSFKAYDVRGEIGVNIDEDIAYRIGRAVAPHFCAKSMVIGFDAREPSVGSKYERVHKLRTA
jgi:phosphomannomutase